MQDIRMLHKKVDLTSGNLVNFGNLNMQER